MNNSTRCACFIQHSSMPRIHLTADWPNSCDLPRSSSIRLHLLGKSKRNSNKIKIRGRRENGGFSLTRTYMLDRDSKQPPHSKHCHEHCQLQYQLIILEIGQILDSEIVAIVASLHRATMESKNKTPIKLNQFIFSIFQLKWY